MTEGKFYLKLLDFISNGICCRWTVAPTELPWIRLANVCGKYRLKYTGSPCNVCRTSGRFEIWWRSNLYQHLSSYQDCNATDKVTFHYSARYQFCALIFSVAGCSLILESREIYQKYITCGGKQWQITPKNVPRMQLARVIPVAWLSSGLCPNRPRG